MVQNYHAGLMNTYSSSLISMVISRTNCSSNGTMDDQCWREALIYRSSELVDRLFSFGSLSIYVNSFKHYHENEVCQLKNNSEK
jgi:hypothetical protein